MKKRTIVIYTSYIWTKTLLGLTFHPYKSIKETIRHPVLFPVIFSPLIGIIILLIVAKIGSWFFTIYGWQRELVALFLSTTLLSILFWQGLLLYLLGSFIVARMRK